MRPAVVSCFSLPALAPGALELKAYRSEREHVMEGMLQAPDGRWFPILEGVPSFLTGVLQRDLTEFAAQHGLQFTPTTSEDAAAAEQAKTNETFSDKWQRFRNYGLEAQHAEFLFGWYCKKLGLIPARILVAFHAKRKRILECGPGSGFNTRFMAEHCPGEVYALDISDAAFTTFTNTRDLANCTVVQADLMQAPFPTTISTSSSLTACCTTRRIHVQRSRRSIARWRLAVNSSSICTSRWALLGSSPTDTSADVHEAHPGGVLPRLRRTNGAGARTVPSQC